MPWIGKLKFNLISDTLPITNNLLPQNSTHLATTVHGNTKTRSLEVGASSPSLSGFLSPIFAPFILTISLFSVSVVLSLRFIISLLYPLLTFTFCYYFTHFFSLIFFIWFLFSFLPFFLFIFYVDLILSLFLPILSINFSLPPHLDLSRMMGCGTMKEVVTVVRNSYSIDNRT